MHHSHIPHHQSVYVERVRSVEVKSASQAVVHPHATLVYFSAGEAVVWCGALFRISSGDAFAIPEGQAHYVQSTQGGSAWVLSYCASCRSSEARRALISAAQSPANGLGKLHTIEPGARATFERHFAGLQQELQGDEPFRELAVDGYLALIASTILRASSNPIKPHQQSNTLCAEALAFIHKKAPDGISLEDVARAVHRSVSHTAAVVKKETGRTVVEWITHSRMAAARELLMNTDESVEAVALRVGFSGSSHFYRVFKKMHHTTPSAWRRTHSHMAETTS